MRRRSGYLRRVLPFLLLFLLPAGSGALGAAPGLLEIPAPPFVVRTTEPVRHQAEAIAASAPSIAAAVGAALGLPPPASGTIVVVAAPGPGDPLRDLAAAAPSWAAGVTLPAARTIVLRLDRIGGYGQREAGQVLAHEIAHLAVAEALPRRGSELPQWFSEGIASAVSADTEILDRWFLWTSALAASEHPFSDLDVALARGEPSHAVAYSGSLAAVNFLRRQYGAGFPARLFSGLRMGAGFDAAFAAAAGVTIDHAERAWREDLRRPRRWIMWIGSAFTLWLGATILILLAYAVKRFRSRRTLDRWRVEEGPDLADIMEAEAALEAERERASRREEGGGDGSSGGETVH